MNNYKKNGRLSFGQYIRTVDGGTGFRMLSEGLIGIKPQIWPAISVPDMFRLLKYDPAWTRKMMYGHTAVSMKKSQAADYRKALESIYASAGVEPPAFDEPKESAGNGGVYKVAAPEGSDRAAYIQKFLTGIRDVCKRMKTPDIIKCFRPSGEDIQITADSADTAARAYTLVDWLVSDKTGSEIMKKTLEIRDIFDSVKTLPADQRNAAKTKAQGISKELDGLCASARPHADADAAKAFATSTGGGDPTITVTVKGYFNDLVLARRVLDDSDISDLVPDAELPAYLVPPKASDRLMLISDRLIRPDDAEFWSGFQKNTEFDYSINENTRGYIKLCDNDFQEHSKAGGAGKWLEDFVTGPDRGVFQQYIGYMGRSAEKLRPLTQFKTFAELKKECDRLGIAELAALAKSRTEQPVFGNSCARRRVKLFRSAEHYGAKFYQNRDWTMTWTTTNQQAYVFGRPKPPCVQGHPDQVFEPANFDDWEEGFDPQYKQLRDNPGRNYVKDHPLAAFNNYCCECRGPNMAWCTSSGRDSGWARGDSTKRGLLIQFMDHRDGQMYQINDTYFQSEGDEYNGILAGLKGGVRERLRIVREKYKSLDALFVESNFDRLCANSISEASRGSMMTPAELYADAVKRGDATDNNWLKVSDSSVFSKYSQILDKFSGFVLTRKEPGAVFQSAASLLPSVLNVNCENVADATGLFSGLSVKTINLESTSGIRTMTRMFAETVVEDVNGLDTSGAAKTDSMFQDAQHPMAKMISVTGVLDLGRCVDARRMFTNSDIGAARLSNCGKIRNAEDMFVGCSMMRNIPDMLQFKSITSPKRLVTGFNGDYSAVFAGCDELTDKKIAVDGGKEQISFDQYVDRLKAAFEGNSPAVTDKDGFLLIDSADTVDDLYETFAGYPGVRLVKGLDNARNLFVGKTLSIKVLDVNGCRDISQIFYNCVINRLDAVVGTEKTVNAVGMFHGCRCTAYPDMAFPAATCEAKVFLEAGAPRKLPVVSYGARFDSAEDEVPGLDGLDMNTIQPPDEKYPRGQMLDLPDDVCGPICNYLIGYDTVDDWIKRLGSKRIAQGLYLWSYKNKIRDFESSVRKDEDGFVLLDEEDISRSDSVTGIIKRLGVPAGFRLAPEAVRSGKDVKCFTGIAVRKMPRVDLNGLKNASGLFAGSEFAEWDGLDGTGLIERADMMFKDSRMGQPMPVFSTGSVKSAIEMFSGCSAVRFEEYDFRNLVDGTGMFSSASLVYKNPSDVKIAFPSLVTGDRMFREARTGTKPGKMSFDFPALTSGEFMFFGTDIGVIAKAAFPSCQNCNSMFEGVKGLVRVQLVDIPACRTARQLFRNCQQLEFVGAVNARRVQDCTRIFASTPALKIIAIPNIAGNSEHRYMLEYSKLAAVYGNDQNGDMLMARNRALGITA